MLAAQRIRTMVLLLIQKNGFATSHRDFYKIMEVTFAATCLYGARSFFFWLCQMRFSRWSCCDAYFYVYLCFWLEVFFPISLQQCRFFGLSFKLINKNNHRHWAAINNGDFILFGMRLFGVI